MSQRNIKQYPWSKKIEQSFDTLAEKYGSMLVTDAANPMIAPIKQMNTQTPGAAFPYMVAARAAVQLATLIDARAYCRTELMPEGTGVNYGWQYAKPPAGWLPLSLGGTAVQPYNGQGTMPPNGVAPLNLSLYEIQAKTVTLPVSTFIEDKLQRQLAYNLAQTVGVLHGNVLNAAINANIYAAVNDTTTATPNANTNIQTTAAGANYTFANLLAARGQVERQRFRADVFQTFPVDATGAFGFYPFIMNNITSVQFTSALDSYVKSGAISEIFGMKIFSDAVYAPTAPATSGANLGAVLQADEAIGWAQIRDVSSEMTRWGVDVGFYVTTSVIGAPAKIVAEAVTLLQTG